MKVIYKYSLDVPYPIFVITLPVEAEVIAIQNQKGAPYMWVLQDLEGNGPFEHRKFVKIGKDDYIADNYKHIATLQELEGDLVWHYFEVL